MIIEIRMKNVSISVLFKCAFNKHYQNFQDRNCLGKALAVFLLQVSHAMIMVPRYFSMHQNNNS